MYSKESAYSQDNNTTDNSTLKYQLPGNLTPENLENLAIDRRLSPSWVRANVMSVSASEASGYLNYTAKSDGMLIKGCNGQVQFRPDVPWSADDGKAPKYRSPLGDYDAILPTCPTDPYYWGNLEALKERCYKIDGHPCLVVTEGGFKAISGCSNNWPTIGLLGVEMGLTAADNDPQKKRYLVPTLERFAKAGFGFIIIFDADCATNKNVIVAQRKLAHQLKLFKVPVYSGTGLWAVEEGKGMDDYICEWGATKFQRVVLGEVVDIGTWEEQFHKGDPRDSIPEQVAVDESREKARHKQLPKADELGGQMSDDFCDRFKWSDSHQSWMEFGAQRAGIWQAVSTRYFEAETDKVLEENKITGYGSASYVRNVVEKMKWRLGTATWDELSPLDYLPFVDGVLELKTGKLLPHSPKHLLTWCLPRPYSCVDSGFPKIKAWLEQVTQGNQNDQELLYHFMAATLRGRSDLQKFVYLIGQGGNGKSTFTQLLQDLIGEENCWNGDFSSLEDKHSVIGLMGRRLAVFADQDKVSGKLGNFKRLTGGDKIEARKLYRDRTEFVFPGLSVVTSNSPIFRGTHGTWLSRRLLMIAFDYVPQPGEVRDLRAEFQSELSALTNYLMQIPNDEITRVLRRLGKGGNTASPVVWESTIRSDSLASWVNDYVIRDSNGSLGVGNKCDDETRAYGHYCQRTLEGRSTPMSSKDFAPTLVEMLHSKLGWTEVTRKHTAKGNIITGIRLREAGHDDETLLVEQQLKGLIVSDEGSETFFDEGLKSIDSNTLKSDEGDALPKVVQLNIEDALAQVELSQPEGALSDWGAIPANHVPSSGFIPVSGTGFDLSRQTVVEPSQSKAEPSQEDANNCSSPEPEPERDLQPGDKVAHVDPAYAFYVWSGTVKRLLAPDYIQVIWVDEAGTEKTANHDREELRLVM